MIRGIYIHVPFCIRKCMYCDFVSGLRPSEYDVELYFETLRREIEAKAEIYDLSTAETLYFGGGTPSLFPKKLEGIVGVLQKFGPNFSEITVESNPSSDFEPKDFEFATRVSFGVQSFSEELLRFLTREHTPQDVLRCVEKALKKFSVNCDLIFGVPGQTPQDHLKDMTILAEMGVHHISCYLLEDHDGTVLHRMIEEGKVRLPDDVEDFFKVQDYLEDNGYTRYEVSNFAKPSFECGHNLLYWNREDFVGFGVSAWSKVGNTRSSNSRDLKEYIRRIWEEGSAIEYIETISGFREVEELIFLGLRKMKDGVKLKDLEAVGIEIPGFLEIVRRSYSDQLLISDESILLRKEYISVIDELTVRVISIAEMFWKEGQRIRNGGS